jgi:parvulin-like peptidyl-prolyl isomerase
VRNISILILTIALASCADSAKSSGGAASTEVAATVNGNKITVADVDRVTAQQLRGQESQLSQLELATARLQTLESLITQDILFQRAQKENLVPSEEEVTNEIQRNKQESSMTEEDFQRQLKESNQTEAQFRDSVRKDLAIRKLRDKMTSQIKVQDREVEDFFRANPKQFVAQVGVAVSDIIADPADNGARFDAKSEFEAEQKIKEVYNRLRSGSDFATIARQQSEHESSYRGGDLGFIPEGQFAALTQQGLPPGLGLRLMAMQEGGYTEPIRDQAGRWHIFKLTQKRTEAREMTLSDPEVRKQISDYILNQRAQLINAALLTRARDEAKIENFLAQRTLENPNTFGVLRPVPQASATPAATATPPASPAVSATPTPQR